MEKLKNAFTYERHCLKYKAQQSKQLSDLFDKVTQGGINKVRPWTTGDTKPTSQDGNRTPKKTSSLNGVVDNPGEENGELMEASLEGNADDHDDSPCPLFQSIIEEESHPKKSRPAAGSCGAKGTKRAAGGKKNSVGVKKHQTGFRRGAAAMSRPATPMAPALAPSSPQYPSIETFRDARKQSLSWSFADQEEGESFCSRWVESVSESMSQRPPTLFVGKEREHPFSVFRPGTPAAIHPYSYVRISTPHPVSPVQMPQAEYSEGEQADESKEMDGGEGSSYTTVYTWTTATATATDTGAYADTDTKAGINSVRAGKGGEGGEEMREDSPTLVLKPPVQDPLQSTAIHPHLDPPLLHNTPHVSPIRPVLDERELHRTPSAPTHGVSPRGPRKTQSFLSTRGRAGPPKCSTMLFASPMADAGDAPLDVSSIRTSLSEAIDLNKDADKNEEKLKNREEPAEAVANRVLTSTPCGRQHSTQFRWNLSSVQVPAEEDEALLPMHSSQDTVNSEEIVATTLSQSSIPSPEQPQEQAAADRQGEREGEKMSSSGDAGEGRGGEESGVVMTSHPDHHLTLHSPPSPSTHSLISSSSSHILLLSPPPSPIDGSAPHSGRTVPAQAEVQGQSECISSGGDGLELSRKEPGGLKHQDTPTSHRTVQRAAEGRPPSCEDLAQPAAGQRSRQQQQKVRKSLAKEMGVSGPQEVRCLEEEEEEVEACVISLARMRGKEVTPGLPQPRQPGLFMWVEPADSGFLDMVSNTPPDIISVVSSRSRKAKYQPQP